MITVRDGQPSSHGRIDPKRSVSEFKIRSTGAFNELSQDDRLKLERPGRS